MAELYVDLDVIEELSTDGSGAVTTSPRMVCLTALEVHLTAQQAREAAAALAAAAEQLDAIGSVA